MVKPEIINERPISTVELKKELESIKKRDKELGLRSTKTDDYLKLFTSLSEKDAEDLRKKLDSLKITRLKEEYIIKIIDTLPNSIDELKSLLQAYVVTINNEDLKKIVDVVKEFIPKKK